jgi:hypothetical protein
VISKATGVYIIMLVIFGTGLWAILSFGSIVLRAPTDVSGKWELRSLTNDDNSTAPALHVMTVEQSGRYARVAIDQDKPRSLKLSQENLDTSSAGADRTRLTFVGSDDPNVTVIFDGKSGLDEYRVECRGPLQGEWRATCVARTYPKHAKDQPATRPAPTTTTTTTPAHARL